MMKRAQQRQAVFAAIRRREWLLQILALGAASCGRGEDRAYARGNTLIIAVDGDANDRPLTPDTYAESLVYLPLLRIDEQGNRQPCLATHWKHSGDYLEWTYRLRPGVRWHDGRPVTVDDVKFTIDMHARPNSPVYGQLRAECMVHDELTFTVRGNGWVEAAGEDVGMSILPKHLVKDLDYQHFYEWDFWLRPVGNGPYRYLRYQPGTMVELEANPDYYKGKPKIERVVLKFSGQAALTELLSGNVDAVQLNDSSQLAKIRNDPRFQTHWWLANSGIHSFMVILWQNEHPLFRDRAVRRALSLAINRRELLQVLNLPIELPLVDGWYTFRQARRGEASEPRYDPAEAQRLLDDSGWLRRNRDGLRERGGQEFRFTALVSTQSAWGASCVGAALFVQDQLRKLGVRMDLFPLEGGVHEK
jgi:peptide/nickel transport system substrate-binding protein